jgi:hypothetical protein
VARAGLCNTVPVANSDSKPAQAPHLTFREEVAGRETLAAIAGAWAEGPEAHRPRASTQMYGDRISNAPGALSPRIARALDDAPEVTVSVHPTGQATHAPSQRALHALGPEIEVHEEIVVDCFEGDENSPEDVTAIVSLSIEQQHTFIIRARADRLKSDVMRQLLLTKRLLPRIPGASLQDVTKVIVEAHGEEASLVRFWTRVS